MAYVETGPATFVAARALALDASRAMVRVVTEGGGLLVLTQNDAPGWRLTVDGRRARGELAYGTFRAVRVPPGAHEVIWTYMPSSLVAGAWITLVCIIAMLFFRRRA